MESGVSASSETWEAALCRLWRRRQSAAVHLQDMDVVGEPVQQRAGEAFRSEHLGPLAVPQPVYFAAMTLLDHRICRMVTESGAPARASPSRRPWLETALFTAPAGNSPLS